MVNRLKLVLDQPEYSALLKMSISELRQPSEQIRYLLREKLIEDGYLQQQTALPSQTAVIQEVSHEAQ